MTRITAALFVAFLGCHSEHSAFVNTERPTDNEILSRLRSDNPTVRETALKELVSHERLTSPVVMELVQMFKFPAYSATPRYGGPVTGDIAPTRVLIKHHRDSVPLLLLGLQDENPDVRRYSAFCVGQIGRPEALPDLKQAIEMEATRASKQTYRYVDETTPLLSPLKAMIQAHAEMDFRGAVDHLAEMQSLDRLPTARDVDIVFGSILRIGPFCGNENRNAAACLIRWQNWWRENRKRPVEELSSLIGNEDR